MSATASFLPRHVRTAMLGGLVSFAVAVGGLAIPVPTAPTASADLAPKAECSTYFQNASGDQLWSTAANWSTGVLPTEFDVACVIDETAVFDSAAVVRQLHGNGTVVVTTGYLELSEVSDIVNVELHGGVLRVDERLAPYSFSQSGGVLNGPGELVIGGPFVWSGGQQSDASGYTLVEGETTIATTSILTWTDRQFLANGELTAFGPAVVDFGDAAVRIADASFQAGHVSVVGSDVRLSGGEVLGSVSLPAGTPVEGEWTVGPNATLQLATSEISGEVQVDAGGSLQIVDIDTDEYITTLTATGSITGEGEISVQEETQLDVFGTIFIETLRSGGVVRLHADALVDDLRTGGQLVLEDGVTLTVVEMVIDGGFVAVPQTSTIIGSQPTLLFGTGELMLDGMLQGDLEQSAGTLHVSDSASASIRGSYTQDGGTLKMGIAEDTGSSLTVEFDTVLGGTLELEAANPVHMTTPILYTTTLTGQFSDFVAGSGLCAELGYEADRVILDSVYCPQLSPIVAAEDDGLATFSVSIHEAIDTPYEFTYDTGDATAVAGSDYVATSGTAVIPAGSTSVGVEVEILDDDVVEDDEDFGLSIVGPLESAVALELATIVDDDDRAGFEQYFQFHGLGSRGSGLYPSGMNGNGVVGYYSTDADTGYSWFWSFEEMRVEHILGIELTSPMDVNENGDILTSGSVRHRGGVITPLSAVPGIPPWQGAQGYAINEAGEVAGVAWPDPDSAILVHWSADNVSSTLAAPTALYYEVTEINNDGVIVGHVLLPGTTRSQAFRFSAAGFELLPGLAGADQSVASSINDAGLVVGNSGGHAVTWAPDGTITDLGIGFALDINSAGTIVGSSPSDSDPSKFLATIWFEGHRFEINDYAPDRAGWNLIEAIEINDDGAIAGKAQAPSGPRQTYVLEPLECFMCVEFSFMEPDVDAPGAFVPIDGGAPATEGDPVTLEAQVVNHANVTQAVDITFHDSLTGEPLQEEPFTRTLAPGGRATVTVDIDTTGMAWSNGTPADPRQFEITVKDADTDVDITSVIAGLTVDPRPIVLVHGLWSDASTWASYQAFATAAHPRWKVYAVDTMDTASNFPKSVAQNAAEVSTFVEQLRTSQNIWSVDIVGHSMGGLISRYYIQNLMPSYQGPNSSFGIPAVDRLVMLGTPNAGSPCAWLAPVPATLELRPEVVAAFNSTVTERNGVDFSVAAGYHLPFTCANALPGDDVVPQRSAAWGMQDVSYVDDMPHTSMTGSSSLFTDFVLPRLNGTAVTPADFFRTGTAPMALEAEDVSPEEEMQALYLDVLTVEPQSTGGIGITVPADATDVAVTLVGPGVVGAQLVDPTNVVRATIEVDPDSGQYPSFRTLSAPAAPGRWVVRVINSSVEQQEVSVGVAALGSPVVLDASAKQVHWSGRVQLTATRIGPAMATPPTLLGVVRDALGTEQNVTLFDDGLHGDGAADDGRYGAVVRDLPAGPTLLTIQVIEPGFMRAASAGVVVTIPSTPPANTAPTATPMTVEVGRDAPQRFVLEGVDPEGDDLIVAAVSTPAHGTLSGITPNVLYTPAAGYTGPDSFTFTVTDGDLTSAPATVTIDVGAAPVEIRYDGPWPASGGQGEEVTLRARLVDATVAGVPDVPVTFHLGDEEWTATTSSTGHAGVVVTLDVEPGDHDLRITSEATDGYRAAEQVQPFTVVASRAPQPAFVPQRGDEAGYQVRFIADAGDADGDAVSAEWDVDGDGTVDLRTGAPDVFGDVFVDHVYADAYEGAVTVTVVDSKGNRGSATMDVEILPYRPLGSLSRVTSDGKPVEAIEWDEHGRNVLYIDPVPGSSNPLRERLSVLDRTTGRWQIASIGLDGKVVETTVGALSGDGRFVAFTALGENGRGQVLLRDLVAGTTVVVSATPSGALGNDRSYPVAVSSDGAKVLFTSDATNLASIPCTNDCTYHYVWDRPSGEIELVSIDPDGSASQVESQGSDISADGTHVAFEARLGDHLQVFVRDIVDGTTVLASVGRDGMPAAYGAGGGQLNADGSSVVFSSRSTNLVDGDTNNYSDVFVRDLRSGVTRSVSSLAVPADGASLIADISGDGTRIVFDSQATNIVDDTPNRSNNIYVADLLTNTIELLSRDVRDDIPADDGSLLLPGRWITCDGRSVMFLSEADNLVPGDVATDLDAFVADTGVTRGCHPDPGPPSNQAPVAAGSAVTTNEDTAIDVVLDASDPDDDELVVEVVTGPSNGAVTGTTDGSSPGLRYSPDANWFGTDELTVRVSDPDGLQSAIVTVTIEVEPVNDKPVCSNLTASTMADVAVTLTASCTDADGDALTLSVGSLPAGVSVSVIGDRLTVLSSSAGTKTFAFTADDGTVTSSPATVAVTVAPAPVPPVPPVTGSLWVSANAKRSEPVPLHGAVLDGNNVHVFLQIPEIQGAVVVFRLDGRQVFSDSKAPYDFRGTLVNGGAGAWEPGQLSDGRHIITAEVRHANGEVITHTATFTIV